MKVVFHSKNAVKILLHVFYLQVFYEFCLHLTFIEIFSVLSCIVRSSEGRIVTFPILTYLFHSINFLSFLGGQLILSCCYLKAEF